MKNNQLVAFVMFFLLTASAGSVWADPCYVTDYEDHPEHSPNSSQKHYTFRDLISIVSNAGVIDSGTAEVPSWAKPFASFCEDGATPQGGKIRRIIFKPTDDGQPGAIELKDFLPGLTVYKNEQLIVEVPSGYSVFLKPADSFPSGKCGLMIGTDISYQPNDIDPQTFLADATSNSTVIKGSLIVHSFPSDGICVAAKWVQLNGTQSYLNQGNGISVSSDGNLLKGVASLLNQGKGILILSKQNSITQSEVAFNQGVGISLEPNAEQDLISQTVVHDNKGGKGGAGIVLVQYANIMMQPPQVELTTTQTGVVHVVAKAKPGVKDPGATEPEKKYGPPIKSVEVYLATSNDLAEGKPTQGRFFLKTIQMKAGQGSEDISDETIKQVTGKNSVDHKDTFFTFTAQDESKNSSGYSTAVAYPEPSFVFFTPILFNWDVVVNVIKALDPDGDGVLNISLAGKPKDNCPNDKNPDQADHDNDGDGDVCDKTPCPNDAQENEQELKDGVCKAIGPLCSDGQVKVGDQCVADQDKDGVADTADNCPAVANADQKDSDGDKMGDDCDACPEDIGQGNSCGGCGVLAHQPNDPCTNGDGACAGSGFYQCNPDKKSVSCNAKVQPDLTKIADDGNSCTEDVCDGGKEIHPLWGDNTSCNDADACNGMEFCQSGKCVSGPALSCDDGNACTTDSCDPKGGCQHLAIPNCCQQNADCNDNNFCTTDSCDAGSGKCSNVTITYVDAPPSLCQQWVCQDGNKTAVPANEGGACDDGNACSMADKCSGGQCLGNVALSCDDGNVCTTDSCDPNGGCQHTAIPNCCQQNADCNDNNLCTTDSCDAGSGQCSNVTVTYVDVPPSLCQQWVCQDGNKTAVPANDDVACDDGNACTADSCGPGGCQHEAIANCCAKDSDCSDNNACTTDTCNVATGACLNAPITYDQEAPPSACQQWVCQEGAKVAVPANEGMSCDDGDLCSSNDQCVHGDCKGIVVDADGNGVGDTCQTTTCAVGQHVESGQCVTDVPNVAVCTANQIVSGDLCITCGTDEEVVNNQCVKKASHPVDVSANTDTDEDGAVDSVDNCPTVANPEQTDSNGDKVGDACPASSGSTGAPPPTSGADAETPANPDQTPTSDNTPNTDIQDAVIETAGGGGCSLISPEGSSASVPLFFLAGAPFLLMVGVRLFQSRAITRIAPTA